MRDRARMGLGQRESCDVVDGSRYSQPRMSTCTRADGTAFDPAAQRAGNDRAQLFLADGKRVAWVPTSYSSGSEFGARKTHHY